MSARAPAIPFVLLALASAGPAAAQDALSPPDALRMAVGQYEQNDYAGAVKTLVPLLYPTIELSGQDDVLRVHRLLGISYYQLKDAARAAAEFKALLALDPGFELDPAVDPIEAVHFFEEVRRQSREEIERARAKQAEDAARKEADAAAERERTRERVYVTRTVERIPFGLTLVPFGVGQFVEGRPTAGWLFLGAESALAATSGALYLSLVLRYPPGARPALQDVASVRNTEIVEIATGTAAWVVIAWGIADAVYEYEPARVLGTTEKIGTPAPGASPPPPPPPVPAPSLKPVLLPFVVPSGGGLVLGGRF